VDVAMRDRTSKKNGRKNAATVRDRIIRKKDSQRKKGQIVRKDTKYTARTRKSRQF
jgi:hypothetical protein